MSIGHVLQGNSAPRVANRREKYPNPLPYTPVGEATLKTHSRPAGSQGGSHPAAETIPVNICDRRGISTVWTSDSGTSIIVQLPDHVA